MAAEAQACTTYISWLTVARYECLSAFTEIALLTYKVLHSMAPRVGPGL